MTPKMHRLKGRILNGCMTLVITVAEYRDLLLQRTWPISFSSTAQSASTPSSRSSVSSPSRGDVQRRQGCEFETRIGVLKTGADERVATSRRGRLLGI